MATLTLAQVYLKQGLYEQALAVYEKIRDRKGDSPELLSKIQEVRDLIEKTEGERKGASDQKRKKWKGKKSSPTERRKLGKPLSGVRLKSRRDRQGE